MTALASILIVIALADWLASDSDSNGSQVLSVLIVGVLVTAAACVNYIAYQVWQAGLVALLALLLGTLAWTGLRNHSSRAVRGLSLAALAATIAVGGLLIPALAPVGSVQASHFYSHIAQYLHRLPWSGLANMNPELMLLILGTLLFLGSTANAIVKTVLTLIRTGNNHASEEQLKGGRYIGPLERWLIFGLALAGQPTAAALVISAKSIIRFPELQSKAAPLRSQLTAAAGSTPPPAQQIDELTEYFLIGSLLSWVLALLAALPIAATGLLQ